MRIAIITNVIPVYRKTFFEKILQDGRIEVEVFCQDGIPGKNLKLCHNEFSSNVHLVKYWSVKNEKLTWQWLPCDILSNRFDAYIFYGNPRVFSNVIWSIYFLLVKKKPVAIWGQAHNAYSKKYSELLRLKWWKLFNHLFVYTDKEVIYLKSKGFKANNIIGMNNGLNQNHINQVSQKWSKPKLQQWKHEQGMENCIILLSCARLENKNNFALFVRALPELIKKQSNIIWCVIGEGDEKKHLQILSNKLGVHKYIRWLGAIYDEEIMAPWFLSSTLLVHPGAIGLSLLHAFGYGLPVVTHNDVESHMPEIAAFKEGSNGMLFEKNNSDNLISVILSNLNVSDEMKQNALNTVNNEYNIDVMSSRFKKLVSNMM